MQWLETRFTYVLFDRFSVLTFVALAQLAILPNLSSASRPNFVVIMSDDQSWVGSSLQMDPNDSRTKSDYYRTPNIERLAQNGMRFSRGYSPAPYCCPTRRSFTIGQSPARHIYHRDQSSWTKIYRQQLSIPQMLKRADNAYKTAHFGKWDARFDGVSPEEMGYDFSDGTTGNSTGGGKGTGGPAATEDPKLIFSLTDKTKDFISQQHSSSTPFYVQLSHYAVHLDIYYQKDTLKSTKRNTPGIKHSMPEFAAMTSDLDTGIGLILDHLRALGIEDNTYLFFFSDNGGRFKLPKQEDGELERNFPLRDGKGSMYEGGLRVPFVVMGPGIAKNVCSAVPVSALDIFPTLANLAGFNSPLPDQLDGGDLLPVLQSPTGQGKVIRRKEFMVFHQAVARKAQSAIMHSNLKLVKTWADNRLELFDLSRSLSESENLSDVLPEERERLHRLLCNYLAEVDAETAKTTSKK